MGDEGSWEEGLEGGREGCRLIFGLDPAVYQQRGKIAPEGCVSDYEDGTRKTWKERKGRGRGKLKLVENKEKETDRR